MNIISNNVVAKLTVAFVAAAMLFALVTPVKAMTIEELQEQIAALTAQLAALSGDADPAPAAGACTFTRSLSDGSEGADVTCLQDYLTPMYFTFAGGSTGYFGPVTTAAVAAWQAANGVAPAVGYFGPVSQAKYSELMAAMPPVDDEDMDDDDMDDDDDSSELGSDEGSIKKVDEVSADESSLEEGQEGGVLAFDVEIEGDVEINRMDIYTAEDGAASDDAEDYFVRAFLMVDGDEVAELDVDDWDQDDYDVLSLAGDDYRLRFSGLDLVFADGDEPEFQVGFEVLGNLDSADLGTDWDVEYEEARYVDGEGFTDTDSTAGIADSFGFDAEEVAELSITKSSDSPDGTTLEVDTDDDSKAHAVFVFEIEEENGVDVTIEDLGLEASSTEADVTTTIEEVILYVDGEEVGSESPNAGGDLDFENLGIEIDGDGTVEVTAEVIFKGSDDYTEGDEVFLTFEAVTDAEDENGNDEGDITGSNPTDFDSDTFTLRSEGLVLDVVSIDEDESTKTISNTDYDIGTFVFEIEVTAFGEHFWMDEDAANVDYDLLVGGVAVAAASSTPVLDIEDADDGVTADYKISKGNTATLTLTVETDSGVTGSTKVRVNSVAYSAADDATEELTENAVPVNDWTSSSLILN